MWVGKVAGNEYLVRFHFTQQITYDFHISFSQRTFLNTTGFIERQIKEMTMIQWDVIVCTGGTRFTTTYQPFNGKNIACVDVTVFFLFQELTDLCILVGNHFVFAVIEDLIETVDKVQETDYFFVAYGNVTGGFVSHVYIMLLLYQTTDGTSHRDNVVIGMRREYDHAFGIGLCTFRAIGVVCVRLAARPSGDGMLQVIEYLDVHVIG